MDLELHQLARELLAQKVAEQKSCGILESLHVPKCARMRNRMLDDEPARAGGHRIQGL